MDFKEELKNYVKRIENTKDTLQTEEATKMALILPFFQLLGYDVFNTSEFCPEYTADIGIKKGEKVDYAILVAGEPVILVEAKAANKKLDNHKSQLFRYFVSTPAKFAILTNGIEYRFYSDLDEANKMDKDPFLAVNLLNIKDAQIAQLSKFQKDTFNISDILDSASLLKYVNIFKDYIDQQFQEPADEFIKLLLQPVYKGVKTQNVIERFRPVVAKAMTEYLTEALNEKLQAALETTATTSTNDINALKTNEHWEILNIVKEILQNVIDVRKISLKYTSAYIAVLYEKNTRKWICRITLSSAQQNLIIPDGNKNEVRFAINDISDLYNYSEQIIESARRYLFVEVPVEKPVEKQEEQKEVLKTRWGNYEMPEHYQVCFTRGPRTDLKKIN